MEVAGLPATRVWGIPLAPAYESVACREMTISWKHANGRRQLRMPGSGPWNSEKRAQFWSRSTEMNAISSPHVSTSRVRLIRRYRRFST
jgi:hypothetical protein